MIDMLYFYAMIVSIVILYIIGDISRILRNLFAVFLMLYSFINLFFSQSRMLTIPIYNSMNLSLTFGYSDLGFFFSLINHIAFFIIIINAINNNRRKNDNGYVFLMFLIFYVTNLMFFAKDLLTFFIMWEFASIMVYFSAGMKSKSLKAGLPYLLMNAAGGLSILFAIMLIYNYTGGFEFSVIRNLHTLIPVHIVRWAVILFAAGMLIKTGLAGMHVWVERTYAEADTNFTSYMSAVLSKIGIFGLITLLYVMFPYDFIEGLFHINTINWLRVFLTTGGTLTAIIMSIIAVTSQDMKKLLAYSSVSQMGYVIASLGIGYKWGLLSAIVIMTVHFMVKTALFNEMAFIESKTGSTDGAELGGLIKRMPFSFIISLISIIALAGIVPLFGFAAKWVFYENMFAAGMYLPLAVAMLASTIAFLYCYRLLSTVYLGIISEENDFRKFYSGFFDYLITGINMLIPIALVVLGIFPYPYFTRLVAMVERISSSTDIYIASGFIESSAGYWNPLWIGSAVIIIFVAMVIKFIIAFPRSRRVTQYDIAMSAEVVNRNTPLHFATNFYDGFSEAVRPLTRIKASIVYSGIFGFFNDISEVIRKMYMRNISSNLGVFVFVIVLVIILIRSSL